ncbi:MAG TPA: right-handed parallel beta-helix repeat-containing protein, partial [Anaeromyxobacteraceae bacterium]|nr:right-handed parallel beta-helix repeat-containing protein [Anaeromyxobacteraceae bacterium]
MPARLLPAALLALALTTDATAREVWHVSATGHAAEPDGKSWATAFPSLQVALGKAAAGDEIWVAKGTYHPDPVDRTVSFRLKQGVAVYGGFAGDEARREERDRRRNRTVLSGEIGKGDRTRNTITIVRGADDAILDGFTIRGAYSTDEARMHLVPADIEKDDMNVGGGMRNVLVAPTVRDCTFEDNHSAKGGAVYNYQKATAAQARFVGVDFVGNSATMRGGAVSNDLGAMPVFVNCTFVRNRSEDKGGGLYNDFAASPTLLNVSFVGNGAVSAGAIGNDGGSSPLLVHVTIRDNHATSGLGGGLYQGTGANNNPILVGSVTDDVYGWHEDLVAALDSRAPAGQTIPLREFIPMSNLAGSLTEDDLKAWRGSPPGYRAELDGERLLSNPLVRKLAAFYAGSGGAIRYVGEYTRPAATTGAEPRPVVYVDARARAPRPGGTPWEPATRDLQQG